MKLEEIIKGITVSEIIGNTTKEISGINIDSRLIEPEHVFVAVKGTQTDGHAYITKAPMCVQQTRSTLLRPK